MIIVALLSLNTIINSHLFLYNPSIENSKRVNKEKDRVELRELIIIYYYTYYIAQSNHRLLIVKHLPSG